MLRLLLIRFWPALLPIALYLLWRMWWRRKGKEVPMLSDKGPWFWVACASLGILIVCFIIYGLTNAPGGSEYHPAEYNGGQVTPGHID